MQISLSVYILFGFQLLVLPWELISYYARKSDKARRRNLVHSLLFILLNFLWLLSQTNLVKGAMFEGVLVLTGFLTGAYSFHYWHVELQLKKSVKNPIILLTLLFFAYVAYSLLQQFSFDKLHWAYFSLCLFSLLVTIYFIGGFIIQIRTLEEKAPFLKNAIITASIMACIVPFVFLAFNSFTLHFIVVNVGFSCITLAYIFNYVRQIQLEALENRDLLEIIATYEKESDQMNAQFKEQNMKIFELSGRLELHKKRGESKRTLEQVLNKYGLTPREKEVAVLLLKGKSNQEIADADNVIVGTIRTHAMKIYKKTGIKGAKKDNQFRKKFAQYIQ